MGSGEPALAPAHAPDDPRGGAAPGPPRPPGLRAHPGPGPAAGARADGWRETYRAERTRRERALRTRERLDALHASGLRERDRAAFDRERYRLWAEAELADPAMAGRLTPVWMGARGELANALTLASLGDYDLRPALRTLAVPTLVVHGRRD